MTYLKKNIGLSIIVLTVLSLSMTSIPGTSVNPHDVREAAGLYTNEGIVTDLGPQIYPAWDGNVINHDEPCFIFLGWIYVDDGVTNEFRDFPQPLKYYLTIGGEEVHLLKNALGRGQFKDTGAAGFPWDQTYGPVYYFYQTFDAGHFVPGVYNIYWEVTSKDPASPSDRVIYGFSDWGVLTVL